mmetsp:Transcript_29905/g.91585  ORF Transcript_29905/g.91585 Transcript_29905/m.91585 type:complete len:210 (+) Transcript_29905:78-707(+)
MRAMHHNHHRRNDRVPLSRGERRVRTCFEEERRSVSRRGRWRRLRGLVATWIARRPSCRRCAGAWSAGRTAGRAAAAARPTASRPRAWDVAPGWSRLRRGVSFRTILKKKEYLVGAPSRRSRPRGRCCCRGRRGAGPGRPCPSRAGRRTPSAWRCGPRCRRRRGRGRNRRRRTRRGWRRSGGRGPSWARRRRRLPTSSSGSRAASAVVP